MHVELCENCSSSSKKVLDEKKGMKSQGVLA